MILQVYVIFSFIASRGNILTSKSHSVGHTIEISISKNIPIDSEFLRIWYGVEVLAAHLVMCCVELVMMARGE